MARWQVISMWKNKPQGQVWRVRDEDGRRGFFKFARVDQWPFSGPLVANEWMAHILAQQLGLPTADLETASVAHDGREYFGVVSLLHTGDRLSSWRSLPDGHKLQAEAYVCQSGHLVSTMVFDTWLTNIDRGSGKNIILFPSRESNCLQWYLIDHAYALYGSPNKWTHPPGHAYWQEIWRFYHVPRGWVRLAHRELLVHMANRIARLPNADLAHMIRHAPDPTFTPQLRSETLDMILRRQNRLVGMIDRWIAYAGEKESRI